MSTAFRVSVLLALPILLTGCSPVSGTKSIIAIIAMLVSVGVAMWGLKCDHRDTRIDKKAEDLATKVAEHERKYHNG